MSGNTIPDIPRPRSGDPETQRFYDAVRQAFAAVQRTDSQALVTYEELGRRLLPLYDQYKNISDKVGGGKACEGASVPGAVEDIATTGAFGIIGVGWAKPVYRGHGGTEVWVSSTQNRDDAVLSTTTDADIFYYSIPVPGISAEDMEGNSWTVKRYIWLRHWSACDKGFGPWSDMITGETTPSDEDLAAILTGRMTEMWAALGLDTAMQDVANQLTSLDEGIHTLEVDTDGLRQIATTLVDKTDANAAAIQRESTARSDAVSALAQDITRTAVKAGDAYTLAESKVSSSYVDGKLTSTASLKTDTNGYIVGLGVYNNGNPAQSGVTFRTDNFYIGNSSGTPTAAFSYGYDTASETNQFFLNGNVRIKKSQITDLEAGAITLQQVLNASTGTAEASSGVIQSASYRTSGGKNGWKIDFSGNAVFNSLYVRSFGGTQQTSLSIAETTASSASGSGSLTMPTTGDTLFLLVGRTGFTGANSLTSRRRVQFTANGVTHDTGLSPFVGDYCVAVVATSISSTSVSVSVSISTDGLSSGDKWSFNGRVVAMTLAGAAKVVT